MTFLPRSQYELGDSLPTPAPRKMTREQFIAWLKGHARPHICIDGAFDIAPCHCGDSNCHGWRLVPQEDASQ